MTYNKWFYYDFIFLNQHIKNTVTDSPVSDQDDLNKIESISKNMYIQCNINYDIILTGYTKPVIKKLC